MPLTLDEANEMVALWHRHHKPAVGHRFSIGLLRAGTYCGAAIVGAPVSRNLPRHIFAEVNRLVTDGTEHACSALYGASARICKEMGFACIQTYILASE